jgi:hypothetical protein
LVFDFLLAQYITNVLMFVAGLMLMILGAIMVSREYWSFFIPKTVIHVYLVNAMLQIGASLMGLRGTYKAAEEHRYFCFFFLFFFVFCFFFQS